MPPIQQGVFASTTRPGFEHTMCKFASAHDQIRETSRGEHWCARFSQNSVRSRRWAWVSQSASQPISDLVPTPRPVQESETAMVTGVRVRVLSQLIASAYSRSVLRVAKTWSTPFKSATTRNLPSIPFVSIRNNTPWQAIGYKSVNVLKAPSLPLTQPFGRTRHYIITVARGRERKKNRFW